MDWKTLVQTFVLVFFAELGDKTQLVTLSQAARSRSTLSVFLGSALALVSVSLIGALAGRVLFKYVSIVVVNRVAGVLLIALGAYMIFKREAAE